MGPGVRLQLPMLLCPELLLSSAQPAQHWGNAGLQPRPWARVERALPRHLWAHGALGSMTPKGPRPHNPPDAARSPITHQRLQDLWFTRAP